MAKASDRLVADVAHFWRPPPRLTLSQWADENFYLSAESAAESGKWHTLAYQRGIMDAITDPAVTYVSVMKSKRVGYTKILNATCGYYAEHDPCPIMVVQPTIEDGQGYSKEEIAPMIRDCPSLNRIFYESKSKDSGNTILQKLFPGGSLSIVGANSPRGFRRVSRKIILLDEIDGYPTSAGPEGDPVKLAIGRSETYWDRKILRGSTPTVDLTSKIRRAFDDGDRRRYNVPCPHCSHMDYLVFKRENLDDEGQVRGHFMHWPEGRPQDAHFVCRKCDQAIEHKHKHMMVENGDWIAAREFNGHASFHIWAAYSYSPNSEWGHIAQEFVDSNAGGVEELKTFVNTVLGETWKDKGEAPEWRRLYDRRELYPQGSIPTEVLFLTCGVDVQKDRLIYEIIGWGREKRSWSIDAGALPGDTADLGPNGPWPELDKLLDRTFRHERGGEMAIRVLAVDAGFNTQTVYNWVRKHPMKRVIACRGVETAKILIGLPSPVDIKIDGTLFKRGFKVWPIGVDVAKSELYGWLKLEQPTEEPMVFPPGYCHFPEYGPEFFKQLTGEELVAHKRKNKTVKMSWEPIPGRENHQLDCRVYGRAAAALFGLDKFQESDWLQLETELGVQTPTDTPPAAPTSAPDGKDKWIKPRPSGWIRRK